MGSSPGGSVLAACNLIDLYCFQFARRRFSDFVSMVFCLVSGLHFDVSFMISLILLIFPFDLAPVA